jgi:glycosyltransferase involved in cell wall biosynthesis
MRKLSMPIEELATSFHRHVRRKDGSSMRGRQVAFIDQTGQLGGAEMMLLDLIPKMDLDARVILLADGPFRPALEARGIPVQVVPMKGPLQQGVGKRAGFLTLSRAVPAFFSVTAQIANAISGADLVYANTPKAWIIGGLAAWRARLPLVCHLHDILSAGHFSRVNRWLMVRFANWFAKAVIANSNDAAEAFVGVGGKADRVSVIPNGFDLSLFDRVPAAPPVPSVREVLSLGTSPFVVMAGRIAPWKGQDVFIKALNLIPGVHGLIVGDALFTEDDRRFAGSLPSLARNLGCADRVHFLGFRHDVNSLYREADIVVHCSVIAEPFGRVVVEGMLCGKPVVAANDGGPRDIIEDGVTGLLHAPGNAEALAGCLKRLLSNPEQAREIARRGQTAARERYDLRKVVAQTQSVLDRVLAQTSRG